MHFDVSGAWEVLLSSTEESSSAGCSTASFPGKRAGPGSEEAEHPCVGSTAQGLFAQSQAVAASCPRGRGCQGSAMALLAWQIIRALPACRTCSPVSLALLIHG